MLTFLRRFSNKCHFLTALDGEVNIVEDAMVAIVFSDTIAKHGIVAAS